MSSNLKHGPLDDFFSTGQTQSKTKVDISNIVVAYPSVLPHNEENNDCVVRCDPEISETHKSWPML